MTGYRSGWCGIDAAPWQHAKCVGSFGHDEKMVVCTCPHHSMVEGSFMIEVAATKFAKNALTELGATDVLFVGTAGEALEQKAP